MAQEENQDAAQTESGAGFVQMSVVCLPVHISSQLRNLLRRVIGIWLRRVIGAWLRRVLVSGIDLDQYVCDTRRKKKKTQNIIYVIRGLIMINLTRS